MLLLIFGMKRRLNALTNISLVGALLATFGCNPNEKDVDLIAFEKGPAYFIGSNGGCMAHMMLGVTPPDYYGYVDVKFVNESTNLDEIEHVLLGEDLTQQAVERLNREGGVLGFGVSVPVDCESTSSETEVIVDPDNKINEMDETNNTASVAEWME